MKVLAILVVLATGVLAKHEKPAEFYPNGCPTNHSTYFSVPHPRNCTLFYMCANGELVKRECPSGLHYNSQIQTCDWPSEAGCEEYERPVPAHQQVLPDGCKEDQNILLPHPTKCSHFYACDHERLVLLECPLGLHFNRHIQMCDWSESAGCAYPNGCPVDSSVDLLLPHPTDCTLFYACDNGQLVLRECPDNLHFNRDSQICDWEKSAGCVVNIPDE